MSFKLSLFEQPNPIWCFVFVTLFNLQGTHRFAAAGVHFTTPFRPCQELFLKFFQTFSALRSARQASPLLAALTGDLISLPYLSSLVKNFFSHRQVVSVLSFKLAFDLENHCLADSFDRIPPLPPFVNPFFDFFQKNFPPL